MKGIFQAPRQTDRPTIERHLRVTTTRRWPRLIWLEIHPKTTRALRRSGFTVKRHFPYTITAVPPEGWAVQHENDSSVLAAYDQTGACRVTYEKDASHAGYHHNIQLRRRIKIRREPARPNLYQAIDARTGSVLRATLTRPGIVWWLLLRYPRYRLPWSYWDRDPLQPWWQLW